MEVVVATSQALVLLDTESGKYQTKHQGSGQYFGIAVKGDELYVAAQQHDAGDGQGKLGSVLRFDKDFQLLGHLRPDFPLHHTHEIAFVGDELFVTSTSDNLIAIFNGTAWRKWYPLGEPPNPAKKDTNHFNSFMVDESSVWLLAHNWGPSEVLRFDRSTLSLQERFRLGDNAHNIRMLNGELVVSSSKENQIRGRNGFRQPVGAWPRGLLFLDDRIVVGNSTHVGSNARFTSTGAVQVFDRSWKLLRSVTLPKLGQIHDIAVPIAQGSMIEEPVVVAAASASAAEHSFSEGLVSRGTAGVYSPNPFTAALIKRKRRRG